MHYGKIASGGEQLLIWKRKGGHFFEILGKGFIFLSLLQTCAMLLGIHVIDQIL